MAKNLVARRSSGKLATWPAIYGEYARDLAMPKGISSVDDEKIDEKLRHKQTRGKNLEVDNGKYDLTFSESFSCESQYRSVDG